MQFKGNLTRGMDRWHGWQDARQKVRQVHFIQARGRLDIQVYRTRFGVALLLPLFL